MVSQCDVRQLSRCVRERVDAIATEPYLGPPARGEHRKLSQAEPGPASPERTGEPPALKSTLYRELHALYLVAFREFAKVLEPGGRVVFISPTFRHPHALIRTNVRMGGGGSRRTSEGKVGVDVARDVERFGFHPINPFPPPLREHPLLRGKTDLPYARPDQHIGRRILVFTFTPLQGRRR
jgi:hypothetical protein